MNVAERDELLIRLDEKTANIYNLTEKQERHLSQLNDKVSKNVLNIALNEHKIEALENGVYLRLNRGQMAVGGGTILSLICAAVIAIGKTIGWW